MKLFGDELGYWELRNEDFDQLTKDVVELLLGKKKSVEYAYKGTTIVGIVSKETGVASMGN